MAELHVITALVEKYRVVCGQLAACECEQERLESQLHQLEAVIKMFRANYDIPGIAPKKTLRRTFMRRNIFLRTVMDILREASEPLSAFELTRMAFEQQGDPNPEQSLLNRFAKALSNTLIAQASEGKVVSHEDVWPWKWSAVLQAG